MSEYDQILAEVTTIASKYSMRNILKGFTVELLNILLQNNLDKLKLAENYDTTIKSINDAIHIQFSAGANLDDFITDQGDRERLYSLFSQWRGKLLAELNVQN
jgi:hypothetical protein